MPERLLAVLLLFCVCAVARATDDRPPNLVLIVCDDAGYADFGFTGASDIPTPRLDRLAAESSRFAQAYVTASVCSPSRAGMLSGRYQQRFGHEMNLPGGPHGIAPDVPLLSTRLRGAGYRTAAVGKWHLGTGEPFRPRARGFDHFTGFLRGSRSYRPLDDPPAAVRVQRDSETLPESSLGYLTDFLGDESARLIGDLAPNPFFLYVAFNAPHTPMHAKPEDLAALPADTPTGKRRRTYAAMMLALDRAVGTILDAIDDAGVRDETIVVFVNDNGGATNNASDNGWLRGMKGSKWEGGVRVPMLVRWPDVLPAGAVHAMPVSTLDIAPTTLTAASAPTDGLDGIDLRAQVLGIAGGPDRALFWRRAVAASVRTGRWKLVRVETNPIVLVDLAADPAERGNVAADHQDVVADLLARLESWESGLIDPLWETGAVWRQNQIRKHRSDVIGRDAERQLP